MISIILPVYKAEPYLSRCIDSIISQTFINWEIILIDDGSPDESGRICDGYANKDARISVIHQKNAGASAARNAGIDLAKGEYLCFVDADDYVTPDYLSSMFEEMEENIDLVFQGITHINNGRKQLLGFDTKKTYNIDQSCAFFGEYSLFRFCGSYCKLFRRDIIEKHHLRYSNDIICAEDYDFLLRYLIHCYKIKVIPYNNYIYISNEGSVSTRIYSFNKEYSGLCQITKSMEEFAKKVPTMALIKQQRFMVTYYTQRVLFANYRHSYTREERILNFKKIDKKFLTYYGNYHEPETKFLVVVKFLFSHKWFHILDLIMNKVSRL